MLKGYGMDTNMTLKTNRLTDINWKFLGLFTLYLGLFIGIAHIPQSLYEATSRFTSWAVATFWKLFLIPVSSSGANVTFYDFTMEIIFECTGLHYAAIFTAAVLAFQGRTVSNKTVGLFAGIGMIFLLNMLRLGMLGMVGHYFTRYFLFVHLYLWHTLFTFFILFLWVLWVNGKINLSWLATRQVLTVVAAASLSFWLMFSSIGYYYSFLASLADGIFPLLGGIMPMPSSVIAQGELLGYVFGDYVVYSKTGLYVLNITVFIALAAAAAVRSSDRNLFMKRFAAGTGLMIFSHLSLMFMDWSLEVTENDMLSSILTWCIVLSSMIAPVVAWLGALLIFRSHSTN